MKRAVELVSTGSELLNGRTVNTHAQALGAHLAALGLTLTRDTTVPDDEALIRDAVRAALARADIVIVSGGLGPTSDDITREAVAGLMGRAVVMDQPSLEAVREKYARLGRRVTPLAERQALVIEGAEVLANAVGMAPGDALAWEGRLLFLLPGPPGEFLAVLKDGVLPRLRREVGAAELPDERIFQLCGLGESDIATRMEEAGIPGPGIAVAYCAAPGRVEVRLAAAAAQCAALDSAAAGMHRLFGTAIYSTDRAAMEEVAGRLLRERDLTLAVAESCTGGLIGHRLTSVSGSSDYFMGGCIAYSNASKVSQLDVPAELLAGCGAVSEEVACSMADGARRRFAADVGLSVTGIAGPTGGSPEKPVGLVYIGLADAGGAAAHRHAFTGNRARIKEWSSQMALDYLRRYLLARRSS